MRNVDELEIVRDFCAEEAPPAPERLTEVRARVVAGFSAAPPTRARSRQRRRLVLPYPALTGGVAALAAAVTATALVIAPGTRSAGPAQLDAAFILQHAAGAALSAPAPGTGQFIYAQVTTRSQAGTGQGGHQPDLAHTQEWVSVTGTQPTTLTGPACSGPVACVSRYRLSAGAYAFTYAGLETLPTAPGPLLDYLYREQSGSCSPGAAATVSRADLEWAAIYSIMTDVPVLPPRFGAALFTAAAQIPGVTVIRNVTTAAGQPGIAVARTIRPPASPALHGPYRLELIFSPYSYRSIGISATQLQAPGWTAATAVTGSRFVATAPPVPGPTIHASEEECWTGLRAMPG